MKITVDLKFNDLLIYKYVNTNEASWITREMIIEEFMNIKDYEEPITASELDAAFDIRYSRQSSFVDDFNINSNNPIEAAICIIYLCTCKDCVSILVHIQKLFDIGGLIPLSILENLLKLLERTMYYSSSKLRSDIIAYVLNKVIEQVYGIKCPELNIEGLNSLDTYDFLNIVYKLDVNNSISREIGVYLLNYINSKKVSYSVTKLTKAFKDLKEDDKNLNSETIMYKLQELTNDLNNKYPLDIDKHNKNLVRINKCYMSAVL